MNSKGNILLVEDDANFGMVLCDYLKMNGYSVEWSLDGKKGYNTFMQNEYDLCILDVMMPEMDGFDLAEEMKRKRSGIPFFFLTAKSLKKDIVKGYELGARDYLCKPFDPEILLLKISAILRNAPGTDDRNLTFKFLDYQLDVSTRRLKNGKCEHVLSPKENSLLVYLLQHQNKLVRREQVLNSIWKENTYFTARSMDVYINKLRKRFQEEDNISLQNIRGEGFVLVVEEASGG